jgi:HlyD family secretion protein
VKRWFLVLAIVLAAAGGYFYWQSRQNDDGGSPLAGVRFGEMTRGPISVTVTATGQLQPVTQVDVGTQVSGTLQEIMVDFNSKVKAGQILARINTDNLLAKVATNRANLLRSEASKDRLIVEFKNSDRQAKRLEDLHEIVSKADLEKAQSDRDSLDVQIRVAAAEIEQAKTTLRQSEIDLEHATITSPIDGVVINRAVEMGQTVAASFNSPLLFQIANDLGKMQIRANVDEADIGRIQRSIRAAFTVDAFPGRTFDAKLEQVRLNPTITSNVVIYTCIFSVENVERDGSLGPLLPGITANLTILVDERKDALLAPAAATRFQPKGVPGVGANASPTASPTAGATGSMPSSGAPMANATQGGSNTNNVASGGGNPSGGAPSSGAPSSGAPGSGAPGSGAPGSGASSSGASSSGNPNNGNGSHGGGNGGSKARDGRRSDGPGPTLTKNPLSFTTLWVKQGDTSLRPVQVEMGLSDGNFVEIVTGDVKAGDMVAIGQAQSDPQAAGSFSPFGNMGGNRGGGMGGGGARRGGTSR